MALSKRSQNEKEFGNWTELEGGGRKYWFDIKGRKGGKARYVKTVDHNEVTVAFSQEIFNDKGILIEIHEKYPIDKGHRKV
ncbi:MAG: hypothetical protein AB7K37_14560 [Cyclobacteriaceae bacterium]